MWKKTQYVGAQSLSSMEPAASSIATPSTSAQCLSSGRPAPSVAPMLSTVAEDQIEPEDSHPTPAMQQRSDVPSQQAYPYVTHTVESESEDDTVGAQPSFGNTLVQHICRNMTDKEAHEAVMNKTWFRKVSEHDAPRLQQRIGSSRPLAMTIPAWASKKQQGEAALWSCKKDNGTGPESSSFSSTPTEQEVKHPLHEILPWRTSRLSWLRRGMSQSKRLGEMSTRCRGPRLRQKVLHLRPTSYFLARLNLPMNKHSARSMKRSISVWWKSARLMRRTGTTIGRVATETSCDLAFVTAACTVLPRMTWREAALALHMQNDARPSSLTNFLVFDVDS